MRGKVLLLIALLAVCTAATPPTPSLGGYVGKYPFDKVSGVTFLRHAIVRQSVTRAVFDAGVRKEVLSGGVSIPIARQGSVVISHACRPHDCGGVNWAIAILAPRGPAAVCYHNAELMGERSRWFLSGFAQLETVGACPNDTVPSRIAGTLATAK